MAIPVSAWSPPPASGISYARFRNATLDCMNTYNISTPDENELRFEVRSGDILFNPETSYQDPPTSERAEISFDEVRWKNNQRVIVEYDFYVPSGFNWDTNWAGVGQVHPNLNTSPTFMCTFRQGSVLNQLFGVVTYNVTGSELETEYPISPGVIVRDTWHRISIELKPTGKTGFLRVLFNNIPVIYRTKDVGFLDQTNWYWRMGIYRNASTTTHQCRYRNFTMREITSIRRYGLTMAGG